MQDDDRPDESIWLDDEALKEHFDELRSKHRSGTGGSDEPDEDVPMMQNELTRGLRDKLRKG